MKVFIAVSVYSGSKTGFNDFRLTTLMNFMCYTNILRVHVKVQRSDLELLLHTTL
jgi:hypothetical protein